MKLSVVIAAYDERENVQPLVGRLAPVLAQMKAEEWEIVFVVEGTDGTREVLEGLESTVPQLRVLYNERPSGLGSAFRRGFASLGPDRDVVVTMDADLNHQPEEIPRLVGKLTKEGADIVIGSRFVGGSHVEGTPLWKRFLSRTMNVAIKGLFGLSVRDKTSGFRVYRGEVLRALSFRNDDFAFLPELLVQAKRAGMTTVEEPIRFVYRSVGRSKMAIARTIWSYVRLLASRFDALSGLAAVLLLSGVALRAAYQWPVHKYAADADSLLTGMRALAILDGHFPVFYSYVRLGALESYLHAAAFAFFGVSRGALTVAPVVSGALLLAVSFGLFRSFLGRTTGLVAFALLALPSPSFIFWTHMPNGYPVTILLVGSTLLLTVRLGQLGPSRGRLLAFGLSAGLGWWCSLQIVTVLLPALAVLACARPDLRRLRAALLAGAGFLVGAFPWIAYNVRHPLATFLGNFAARPAGGRAAVVSNGRYLASVTLPALATTDGPSTPSALPIPGRRGVQASVVTIFFAGLLWAAARAARGSRPQNERDLRARAGLALLALVALVNCALYVVSEAGSRHGLDVRYVLPVYFAFAAGLAVLGRDLALKSKPLSLLLVAVVLAYNVTSYDLPGSANRRRLQTLAEDDRIALRFFSENGIRVLCGDYWSVYPFNFLSRERILGIPARSDQDVYGYGDRISPSETVWALLSFQPEFVKALIAFTGWDGTERDPAPGYLAFLPERAPGTASRPPPTLAELRDAWVRRGLP